MAAKQHVLITEDEPQVQQVLTRIVSELGLIPHLAVDLKQAKAALQEYNVSLVILDRILKDEKDSIGLCLELKKDPKTRVIPVIILTGLEEFEEKIKSYKAGADLFLNKPFQVGELKRYIRAFLARTPYKSETGSKLCFGAIALDLVDRTVLIGDQTYRDLSVKQFDFLYLLAAHQGKTVTRESIVLKLWNNEVRDKEVDVLVSRLRARLGDDASIVEPVRGRGYRLLTAAAK